MSARSRTKRRALALLLVPAVLGTWGSSIHAGGPRSVNGVGQPMAWNTVAPVRYNPDQGPLGQLNNASARALLAQAFAVWEAGPAGITFTEGPLLSFDVNANGFPYSNPAHFRNVYRVHGDGRSPVIFDNNGAIIDSIFGIGARFDILGVASIDNPIGVDTQITGASIVINGLFYDGVGMPVSPDDVTLEGLKAAMVHEIGHFINLDHSYLNHEMALDDNPGNDKYVPSMFPLAALDEAALASTNPDDERAAQNLYPAGSGQTISGAVSFAGLPFQGAQVVLRKTDDPLLTAYSVVSGATFFPCNPASLCNPCTTVCDPGDPPEQGAWSADFLPAGSYRVCVEQIDTRFSEANGTFVGPLANQAILGGPEECYDAAEGDTASDDPDDVLAVSGGSSVDIMLNALPTSDSFEPNDTLSTGATLADLSGGGDTVAGVLGPGDLDVFNVPVTTGQRVRIDLDARELGSSLDAVIGFYSATNTLIALSDDAVDPDSGAFSRDSALEFIAPFSGTGKVVVSSFPDFDLNGSGGASSGGYWLRVEVTSDTDGDGTPDPQDICPASAHDDADHDGLCFGSDTCPTRSNPTQDAPYKISGSMVAGGSVSFFAASPDGSRVVYVADQSTDEVFDLYSVPVGGGSPTQLSPFFGAQDVTAFRISADSSTVVYMADQDSDEEFEIYSVPIGGGTSTQLNAPLVSGGDVLEFAISPDSTRVVYRADQDVDSIDELFSVPIGGGTVTQLNAPFVAGGSMVDPGAGFSSFLFSADSSRVVYEADQDTSGMFELYSVPIAGGGTTKLNDSLIAAGDVTNFNVDTINSRVFFRADAATDQRFELYSVPLAGGTVTKLNGTITPGAAGIASFRILWDGSRVIYRAAQDTVGRTEVYSVPAEGGTVVKLNDSLVSGGNVVSIFLPVGSGDGARMMYRADQNADEVFELFSVPVTGGSTPIKLNPTLVSGGDVSASGDIYESRAIFAADDVTDGQVEAYTVPVTGGTITQVSGTMVSGGSFVGASFTPTKVAILMDKDTDETVELYATHYFGGLPLKLNATLVAGGDVSDWDFTGDDPDVLVYLADQDVDERFELYARPFSLDRDADGVFDDCDLCSVDSDSGQDDTDGNGLGDACQPCALGTDPDGDNECGAADNCGTVDNPDQDDFDADGAGDACDVDDDDDGLADAVETDTGVFVSGSDTGTDPLDPDSDDDGVADGNEVLAGTNPNDTSSFSPSLSFGSRQVINGSPFIDSTVCAVDFDGDGDQDLMAGGGGSGEIAWYENNGFSPVGWTERLITNTESAVLSMTAADMDGDGDMDVVSGADAVPRIAWFENLGGAPLGWSGHTISNSASSYSSVAAADVDGDGDMDAISASYADNRISWYENDGNDDPSFTERIISSSVNIPYGAAAADVDGDGDTDVLVAAYFINSILWFENSGTQPVTWTQRTISTTATTAYTVFAADVDGDGDMDALSASSGANSVEWYRNDGNTPPGWSKETIATGVANGQAVFATDMDHDGDVDVLTASFSDNAVRWFESSGGLSPGFAAHVISNSTPGAHAVLAADVDDDGDQDILSVGQLDGTLGWHENRSIHRNAHLSVSRSVSSTLQDPVEISLADVDGDGDLDIVSGSTDDDTVAWHQNSGSSPPTWTTRTISTAADGVLSVAMADVDGDGNIDALSASSNDDKIAWHQNDPGIPAPVWTERVISTGADGASSVAAADVDGDGDIDVLSVSENDSKLAWHESDGDLVPGWTEHSIQSGAPLKRGLAVADLDGDGDLDVITARPGLGTIAWFENDGLSDPGWTERTVSATTVNSPQRVTTADLDRDGDIDVVTAEQGGSEIVWFSNDGGSPPTFTRRSIPGFVTGWLPISAADLDADGDVDLMSASGPATELVYWWENNGDPVPFWQQHLVAGSGTQTTALAPGDLDGDGDLDLATALGPGDIILWVENRGGQFTLDTAVLPAGQSATIADGTTAAVLSITLTSRGRAGDNGVELSTLQFLITDPDGPLASDVANSIIDRMRIYLDNGSGVFEKSRDTLVTTVDTLELSPLLVPFEAGDPRVRVEPGQKKTYFVVLEISPSASSLPSPQLKLKHVMQSGSTARDAATGAVLTMQPAPDTSTPGFMQVVPDAVPPSVVSVYPPDQAVDVSLSTSALLIFSEALEPASAEVGVALYFGGVKVPCAIAVDGASVTVRPVAPLALGTSYQLQVTSLLRDRDGNPATEFTARFRTTTSTGLETLSAAQIGDEAGGATLIGGNADDNSGFAAAALGDINATSFSSGIADLIIGAPHADAGAIDAGQATLIFGSAELQSSGGAGSTLTYRTGIAQDLVGETVAEAGDINGDGVRDFFIGAPHSDRAFTNAGAVYLVFGHPFLDETAPATQNLLNLPSCAQPTLCGVTFFGAAANDLAGASLAWVGDVNGDGRDDVAIGAPGANPVGRTGAGCVYLIYGPLGPGIVPLGQVGTTVRGVVLNGETNGDALGTSVSIWRDQSGDGLDDLLVGAPGADALSATGSLVTDAGYAYAVQGGDGPGRLDDSATPGGIEMSRVANGAADQVAGMVFIGSIEDGHIGRSMTGAVDIDGNGVDDILIAGDGIAYAIAGDDPKTRSGSTLTNTTGGGGGLRSGQFDAQRDFGAVMYVTGNQDPLTVGPAGDLNGDGYDDFIIGSPLADTPAGQDAGRAYIILGSPAPETGTHSLNEVGSTIDGFIVEGAGAGDNLGASVGGGHDLNGDGIDDGLVGAPFADSDAGTPADAGETYVISPLRPGEVDDVVVTDLGGGIVRIEWPATDLAYDYNVYRGLVGTLLLQGVAKTSAMTHLACGLVNDSDADLSPDIDDAAMPPAGDAWFYLVTARNGRGEGPLGPSGAAVPPVNDQQCP